MQFGWFVRSGPGRGLSTIEVAGDASIARDEDVTAVAAGGVQADDVLASYRADGALESPIGIAAAGVYDARNNRLLAARDRTGVYPLFVVRMGGDILVGSDLPFLHSQLGRRLAPSRTVVAAWLAGAPLAPEETLLEGLTRVPPGHVLEATPSTTVMRRSWRPPLPGSFDDDAAVEFGERLESAIAQASEGAPTAIFLSGGIDSSAVAVAATAVAAHRESSLPVALCVDVVGASEAAIQSLVADNLGLQRSVRTLRPDAGLARRGLERIGSSIWPTPAIWMPLFDELVTDARAGGAEVLLDGQGGDDLLDAGLPGGRELLRSPLDFVRWLRAERRYVGTPLASARAVARSLRTPPEPRLPVWLAADPELARELRVRIESRPRDYAGMRAADAVDAVLSAQREETFHSAAARGMRHVHPYWTSQMVELLDGLGPAALVGNGDPKSPARRYLRQSLQSPAGPWPRPAVADAPIEGFFEELSRIGWSEAGGVSDLVDLGVVREDATPEELAPLELSGIVSVGSWIRHRGEMPQ